MLGIEKFTDKDIVVDTNLYYSLIGLSPNPKVDNDKFNVYKKYITTASLVEMLTNQEFNKKLKEILSPILKEEYTLIDIGYAPVTSEQIKNLYSAVENNNKNYISKEIDILLEQRIEKEVEFQRWFFIMIISIVFDLLLKVDSYSFKDKSKHEIFIKNIKSNIENSLESILKKSKFKLKEAYRNNDEMDKVFKNNFEIILYDALFVFYEAYYNVDENETSKAEVTKKVNSKIKSHKNKNGILSFFQQDKYKEYAEKLISIWETEIHKNNDFNDISKKFILEKLRKMIIDSSKLPKNDIFDLLISVSLGLHDEIRLVTIDEKFIKILENIDSKSYKLIIELGLYTKNSSQS